MEYKTISGEDIGGKTVFLRVDLNSPVVGGKILPSARLREHAKTISFLARSGAKVVVFSHQGREGKGDFISLEQHAAEIARLARRKVQFCRWSQGFAEETQKIKWLNPGEVLLLENTRFLPEETREASAAQHSKSGFVAALSPLGDLFVQDALSVCHRPHASVVGFSAEMPSFAGPCLERELKSLERAEKAGGKKLLVLGGAKPKDSLNFLKKMLETNRAGEAAIGGLFGELFLWANGTNLGGKEKFFTGKGFAELKPELKKVLNSPPKGSVCLPVDFAVSENGKRKEVPVSALPSNLVPFDIGSKTVSLFSEKIKNSGVIIFNGPMGRYEEKMFRQGTKKILSAISSARGFSILGGGDTEEALSMLGFKAKDFGFVSLAGKALLAYLSGEKLPGLGVLGG